MAQWVRAPDCSSEGPEFKSHNRGDRVGGEDVGGMGCEIVRG